MPVSIRNLKDIIPKSYPYYFFDANVWLAHLKGSSSALRSKFNSYEAPYKDFFDHVLEFSIESGKPKVIVTGLLISEVFNSYLKLCFKAYQEWNPKCAEYKRDYRPTDDYSHNLKTLIDDFSALREFVTLEDDQLNSIDPYSFLSNLTPSNDFNDLFYYFHLVEIRKKTELAIVTHDKDFVFHGVAILTANKLLLSMR